ncbi:hypothetical protein HQN87_23095 [Paenibacillus tritici]|uniref:Uncharacterized protein n=1 Tax=Paenibacillus tritici TaxID=1873425 RepID=A0ABX2DU53_9BACL|nr:hypothetical protein [Paenibacillus tritici]NQX48218.1 hypothetical protein [Paenibacillus tritici]
MNKRKILQVSAFIIILAVVFQAGVFAYAKVAVTPKVETKASNGVSSGPVQSEVVRSTFDQFLKEFTVQEAYRTQIEQWVTGGYSRADVMTAYDFLYHNFGTIKDGATLLEAAAAGKDWATLFTQYRETHAEFIPRSFDPAELELLMQMQGATSDDIMIADRLSFVTGKVLGDLLNAKLKEGKWSGVFVRESVLYSGDSFPRVQLTEQELHKYTQNGKLTEQQVTHAFVLAHKLGESAEVVVSKLAQGVSDEMIMAQSYLEKYGE